jgi:sulfotransferase
MIHYISGLPRTGSTLLATILKQNPKIHTGISSPLMGMINGITHAINAGDGFNTECDETTTVCIMRNIFNTYFDECPPIRFDTNFLWTSKLSLINTLYPGAKVLCCVRSIPEILNSFEQLYQKSPLTYSRFYDQSCRTVFDRANYLMNENRVIGSAYNALKEGLTNPLSNEIVMVIEYEDLTKHPALVIDTVYRFLELEPFEHNFNKVGSTHTAYDTEMMCPGLHDVRDKVEYLHPKIYLPAEIVTAYSNL